MLSVTWIFQVSDHVLNGLLRPFVVFVSPNEQIFSHAHEALSVGRNFIKLVPSVELKCHYWHSEGPFYVGYADNRDVCKCVTRWTTWGRGGDSVVMEQRIKGEKQTQCWKSTVAVTVWKKGRLTISSGLFIVENMKALNLPSTTWQCWRMTGRQVSCQEIGQWKKFIDFVELGD